LEGPRAEGFSEEALRRRLALSGTMTRFEVFFAIEATGRLIGEIQARKWEGGMPPGVFELGIEIFNEADRGLGYGSEATALLASYLFEHEGARRFQASTDVANERMRRALERLGFVLEGVLREFMPSNDGSRDHVMYGMTRNDWESAKTSWT
jgi:RimJ/RimL family protein N-acetyltransferase